MIQSHSFPLKASRMLALALSTGLLLSGLSAFVLAQPVPAGHHQGDVTADTGAKQGEVLKVIWNHPGGGRISPEGNRIVPTETSAVKGWATLAGQKAPFYALPDGSWLALVPVSVFQKPGAYTLTVAMGASANAAAGNNAVKAALIRIEDGHYQTQNVNVSKTTEGLKPLPGELEAIQALKDTETSIAYWHEPFITPTPDCQNSPFGVKRLHNGIPTGDYHKGVDLRSPMGRPIRATAGGKIQIARMYRLHGGTVGIDHGQGVESIYIHMSRLNVTPGDTVKQGDVIGYVGSTGFATGPHLHWGLYVSGMPVNPNQWILNVPVCR